MAPMQKPYRLDPRHLRFIDEYLKGDGNGAAAAIAAGYTERRAKQTAHDLLKREDVAAEIARRRAEVTAEVKIGMQDVIFGLHKEATLTGDGSTQAGRVAAWSALGKFLGGDKLALTGPDGGPLQSVARVEFVVVDPAKPA